MIWWYKVLGFNTSNLSSMTQSAGSDEVATNPLLFFVFLIVQHACVQWCHWAFIQMLISMCVRTEMGTDGGLLLNGVMSSASGDSYVCACVLMCISFIQWSVNAAGCRALNGSLCESGYRAQLKRWKTEGLLKMEVRCHRTMNWYQRLELMNCALCVIKHKCGLIVHGHIWKI